MRGAALFLILIQLGSAHAAVASLHELVTAQMATQPKIVQADPLDSFVFEAFVPFQNIEYRYAIGDTYEREDRSREQHSYSLNLKSLTEIVKSPQSRKLSRQLLRSEREESVNQSRFDKYIAVVNHLVSSRLTQVLEVRRTQLQRIVDRYNQKLGQQKISAKDLLEDFRSLQKVEAEYSSAQEQVSADMPPANDSVVRALLDNVSSTQQQLLGLVKNDSNPVIDRKQIEMKLDRINREIKWADDTKLIDHIDFQHRSIEHEDTVRIAFNVPFLRFDRENQSREAALLRVKEREVAMEAQALKEKQRRNLLLLNGLAAQVNSVKSRFHTTNTLITRLKTVQDLDLRSQLIELNSQLERDILTLGQRYYTVYLEYLRDTGAFGRMDVDFLDAKWKALN